MPVVMFHTLEYEKETGMVHRQFVACLKFNGMALQGEGEDVLAYTKKWDRADEQKWTVLTEQQQKNVLALLSKHIIQGEQDKEKFKKLVINTIDDVQFYWMLLTDDIDDLKHSDVLLIEVVKLWVTVRGFSIAVRWLEDFKNKSNKTTQKSTGLRKSISGTS